MIIYELLLNTTNLKNYIFYAPRLDMFSANREGFYSSIGYISLHLIGMTIGRQVFSTLYINDEEIKKFGEENIAKEQKRRENYLTLKLVM
jgi:phosphatidylinositol glycan class W